MKAAKTSWLMKSEPTSYSIDALQRDGTTAWSGIRNFQSRNYMQRDMRMGDEILFYHSSCPVPGIYGLANVASAPYPDPTQFDTKSPYYEPRATKEKPVWYLVDIAFVQKFSKPIPLARLREQRGLQGMALLRPGSRLSITPVTNAEFVEVTRLARV